MPSPSSTGLGTGSAQALSTAYVESASSSAPAPYAVQALLYWQTCTLCAIAGLLALQWPVPALVAVGLIIWADAGLHPVQAPSSPYSYRRVALRLLLLMCCFGGAWLTGKNLLPPQELLPPWASGLGGTEVPQLQGVVEKVQGMTDNRLRIILRDVSLHAKSDSDQSANPLTLRGKLVWTWDSPPEGTRPMEGETWTMRLPLRNTEGFANTGLASWGFASRTQDHLWRVWNKGQRGAPQRLVQASAASAPALWRENLRQRFFTIFPPNPAAPPPALQSDTHPSSPSHASPTTAPSVADNSPPNLTQAQAIVPALLFGDRSALSTTTLDLFTKATLVHSLALSGQHLGVTVLLSALCVSVLAYCVQGTFLQLPRHTLIVVCALPLALLYLWLGNAPASLQRAACMLVLLAFCLWKQRTLTTLDIVCGALLCLMLLDPLAIFNLGLQLSALCVISIGLVMPLVRACAVPAAAEDYPPMVRMSLRGACSLARILCISCAIQIALLPVNLLAFHSASIWFYLNILWLPVLACVVLPCSVLALACTALHLPSLAQIFALIATWPCELLLQLLHWLSTHGLLDEPSFVRPHWTSVLGYTALLVATALVWQRKHILPASRRLAVAGALLLFLGPVLRYAHSALPAVEVSMLDVGQGQAVVVNLPHEKRLLIDGGGSFSPRFDVGKAIVAPTLAYNRAPRVDILINTHPHLDHRKGLEYLQQHFQSQSWFDNTSLAAGDSLSLCDNPPLRLDVLYPPRGFTASSVNNASLIMRLVVGTGFDSKGLALFMGDAEAEAIASLLAQQTDLRAEVLVVPHHGSKTSYSPALYDAVQARFALISHALQNRYGSPAPQVVQALEERGIRVYRTALHGQSTVRWAVQGGILEQAVAIPLINTEQ